MILIRCICSVHPIIQLDYQTWFYHRLQTTFLLWIIKSFLSMLHYCICPWSKSKMNRRRNRYKKSIMRIQQYFIVLKEMMNSWNNPFWLLWNSSSKTIFWTITRLELMRRRWIHAQWMKMIIESSIMHYKNCSSIFSSRFLCSNCSFNTLESSAMSCSRQMTREKKLLMKNELIIVVLLFLL